MIGLADVLRTSLGPRGMDKMIQNSKGEVLITNDGATILKNLSVLHPIAKIVSEITKKKLFFDPRREPSPQTKIQEKNFLG